MMGEPAKDKEQLKAAGKYRFRLVMVPLCLIALVLLAVASYLATPLPARQLSRLVTGYLHQEFSVESVDASGGMLLFKGVRLANPPGFSKGSLASVDTLSIAPRWTDLLSGGQHYRVVALDGIRISLEKNSAGAWNFGKLQQLLAARKPSPAETRIGRLTVKNGSLTVNGQGVHGISLQVFNLATKGSGSSTIDLAFEDATRNRFTLKGQARPGSDPALDLTLASPALSLRGIASLLKLKNPEPFREGTGSLRVDASLHQGELSGAGSFRFAGLKYAAAGRVEPLAGNLEFEGAYNLKDDAARLKKFRLTLNGLVQLHAEGSLRGLKRERAFVLDAGFSEVELATLAALVPARTRRDLTVGGKLSCQALHLTGTGSTVTGASGTLRLAEGTLSKAGRLYLGGVAGSAVVSRAGEGVRAQGRLSVSRPQGRPLVEALDLPFDLTLSRRLRPQRAESEAFSAQVMGIAGSGRLSFQAGRPAPVGVSLKVPAARLAALKPFLARYDLKPGSGSAALTLELSGKSLQQLAGSAVLHLAEVQATRGATPLALKQGTLSAQLQRADGELRAQGNADLKGLSYNGKAGDARFTYRIAGSRFFLENAAATADGVQLSVARLGGVLPLRKGAARDGALPVALDFEAMSVKKGALEVGPLSGRLRASLRGDDSGRWLEGDGDLAAAGVTWQGKNVGAPTARLSFSRPGAKADLGGALLGGALSGTVTRNPFAPDAAAGFNLALKGAELAAAAPLFPKGTRYVPSAGVVDLGLEGTWGRDGVTCRFTSKGTRLAVAGADGKALVSGASLGLAGEFAKGRLSVREAVLSPGPGVSLTATGEIARPFSGERAGRLSFTLAEAGANALVDPLVSFLPRVIQEATLDGSVAARGAVEFKDGAKLLEGALDFKGGRFELAQQKLAISGIEGRFPFSLDLSGKTGSRPPAAIPFSRENYPQLFAQLSRAGRSGETLKIGKIGFGPMELGLLTLHLNARNGLTEISSLNGTLYEGMLLGKGYLTLHEGLGYRGDLLINGLSLRQLCSIFPGIKGYISGRVDGVLSVSGGKNGIAGLSGFTELWAREGGGEKMLVSKEFLQRLAKQKLGGFFFRSDRSYDEAEVKALMEEGYLTFETLKIRHTNLIGVRDLEVSVASTQNRIALDHLFDSVKQAASRGKATTGPPPPEEEAPAAEPSQEFKWGE